MVHQVKDKEEKKYEAHLEYIHGHVLFGIFQNKRPFKDKKFFPLGGDNQRKKKHKKVLSETEIEFLSDINTDSELLI